MESQNSLGWKGAFKGHLVHPCCEQRYLHPEQVAIISIEKETLESIKHSKMQCWGR